MRAFAVLLVAIGFTACSEPSTGEQPGPDAATEPAVDAGGCAACDGGGVPDTGFNPNDPDNKLRDSDCDGLTDAEELQQSYAGGKKTDPLNPDSDGDGIKDGLELGRTSSVVAACNFAGDADPATRTQPTNDDSDQDGIKDGDEDSNRDGKYQAGETDPLGTDSDGDGVPDGLEDADHDGRRGATETDPRLIDSDADGVPDGLEDLNRNGVKDANETDPRTDNSDGDGCKDGDEDKNHNGRVDLGETDPRKKDCPLRDSDCDGLLDGDEDRNGNGAVDTGETNPARADTDGDGLKDGLELGVSTNPDPNCTAFRADASPGTKTNPLQVDSDCDGLSDGAEDANANGTVDPGETDPNKRDSDGDGLLDGLELGVCTNPDTASCPGFARDADCGQTKTSPTLADTDGDGIADGAEDVNHNGRVDSGELNPNLAADGLGPAAKACATQNLKPVNFVERLGADLQLALATDFAAPSPLSLNGSEAGLMVLAPAGTAGGPVAGIALRRAATGTNTSPSAEEVSTEALLAQVSTLSQPLTQTFTTWDGYPAVHASYELGDLPNGSATQDDLVDRANAIAKKLLGATPAGLLTGAANAKGPFVLEAVYVFRSTKSVVTLMALTPKAGYAGGQLLRMDDLSGGSALAQFGDDRSVNCETFNSQPPSKVDFLFVIDDSASMGPYQAAVRSSAQAMAQKLATSAVDWRIAVVTTSYPSFYDPNLIPNAGKLKGFTSDIEEFRSWLDAANTCVNFTNCKNRGSQACGSSANSQIEADSDCKVGTVGDIVEQPLQAARAALQNSCDVGIGACKYGGRTCAANADCPGLLPATAAGTVQKTKLRGDAQLVVVLVGDADDQYSESGKSSTQLIADYTAFFKNFDGAGHKAQVHGIVCLEQPPSGAGATYFACGETQSNPRRNLAVVQALGGVTGAIDDLCETCVVSPDQNNQKVCNLVSPTQSCTAASQCALKCHQSKSACTADADCLATIPPTVSTAVDAATANVSPYVTGKPPISSTLKVAMDPAALPSTSACRAKADDIPRDRTNGFDFDAASRKVEFFGDCIPTLVGKQIALSYRYYTDVTPNPDGNPPPCSADPGYDSTTGKCRQPLLCNRVSNKCECPSDCGTRDFGVQPPASVGYVCDVAQCKYVCSPDCGGSCTGNLRCDTATCGCKCDLNTVCPAGFKLDASSCQCVCDVSALTCGATFEADPTSCACVCKPNCGTCPTGSKCNATTCACTSGGPQ